MYVEGEGGMHVSTSTLNEELGNVDFILSDKTGTLTKNNMICYGFSMGGYRYLANSIPSKTESKETIMTALHNENGFSDFSDMEKEYIIHFLRSLFLCNSVCHDIKRLMNRLSLWNRTERLFFGQNQLMKKR